LRVPTGAFVAVRNGVAFPTGNSGFPKRRDMLKPAFEPLCLAYKPGGKRTMQVDECRIGTTVETWPSSRARPISNAFYTHKLAGDDRTKTVATGAVPPGRWPANICHSGEDEVLAAFPQSAGSVGEFRRVASKNYESTVQIAGRNQDIAGVGFGDSGSAARFFWSPKAGAEDRWGSRHPTVKPVELMKWLVALVCPPAGLVLDPFAGSGTTGAAALATGRNAILIERELAYYEDIKARIAHYEGAGQHSRVAKGRRAAPERSGADGTPLFAYAASPATQSEMAQQLCDTAGIESRDCSDD
jgi:site-specific DNA-methyltransferase (adenine-specific)